MIALLRDLGASDPGLLLAIGLIFGAVFGIVATAVCLSWGPTRVDEGGAS